MVFDHYQFSTENLYLTSANVALVAHLSNRVPLDWEKYFNEGFNREWISYCKLKNPLNLLKLIMGILEDVGKFIFINIITLW